jgi:hypothetical protein
MTMYLYVSGPLYPEGSYLNGLLRLQEKLGPVKKLAPCLNWHVHTVDASAQSWRLGAKLVILKTYLNMPTVLVPPPE